MSRPFAAPVVLLAALFCAVAGALGQEEKKPAPVFTGQLSLVRYDLPLARSDGLAPTRQPAKRRGGSDAVDWPNFTLNGQPVFREKSEESVSLSFHKGAEAKPFFQRPTDEVIQPGNHWLRAMEWLSGKSHIYTADGTARCSNMAAGTTGRYELWLFPIIVSGEGGPVVKNVEVKVGGVVFYKKPGPWRSLTLLLPQNEPGKPYELSVDGRPAVKFDAGLQPVKLGVPRDVLFPVKVSIAGDGPKIVVQNLARPEEFPHAKEWGADLATLGTPIPAAPAFDRGNELQRYLGIEVPYSPLTIYAAALPHGMSGGFYKKGMDQDAYAKLLASTGYDTVFEQANALPAPDDPESFERRAATLARHGVRLGLQYDNNWSRPSLQHPNVAFFAHTLADWHAPLYRSLSLAAQRFARLPNFAGLSIGADNAGYASYWSWAPPAPDRPWGEGVSAFLRTPQPRIPRAPSLGRGDSLLDESVPTQADFVKYVERYETSFRQYGYFSEAVRAVDPALVFTTGSFGSSPGAGGRGGWPWASMPGRVIYEDLNTQQAYDWNELHASKPLHNVALLDRLHSYAPTKRSWALLDNFHLLFGREAYQRACALALTPRRPGPRHKLPRESDRRRCPAGGDRVAAGDARVDAEVWRRVCEE